MIFLVATISGTRTTYASTNSHPLLLNTLQHFHGQMQGFGVQHICRAGCIPPAKGCPFTAGLFAHWNYHGQGTLYCFEVSLLKAGRLLCALTMLLLGTQHECMKMEMQQHGGSLLWLGLAWAGKHVNVLHSGMVQVSEVTGFKRLPLLKTGNLFGFQAFLLQTPLYPPSL